MKIIQVDNFNRETVSDTLIAENVNKMFAKHITDFLNEKFSGGASPNYYRAVDDNYKLYEFEP